MAETVQTFCRICEALCGLEVTVEGDQVVDIKPDDDHVATRGYACLKGLKQHKMYGTPDRLLYPMQRIDGELQRVSWDDALSSIGGKVRELIDNHGRDSIAMYVGTAAGFGVLHPVFAQGFMQGVGSASMFASATQDCANKFAVAHQVYGFPFTQPFPDLDNTECLIIVGANPAISKWSFLQVSNPIRRLKEVQARGAKIEFDVPLWDWGRNRARVNSKQTELDQNFRTEEEQIRQQLVQSEKLSAAGTLAAGIAHDVCSPLTSVSPLIKILKKKALRKPPFFKLI